MEFKFDNMHKTMTINNVCGGGTFVDEGVIYMKINLLTPCVSKESEDNFDFNESKEFKNIPYNCINLNNGRLCHFENSKVVYPVKCDVDVRYYN